MRARVVVSLVVACAAVASGARAEPSEADKLFTEGTALLARGQYDEACAKLAASERLEASVGTLLYLGACHEAQGKLASASRRFREAEALATARGDGRASIAHARAESAAAASSHVILRVDGGAAQELEITIDDDVVPKAVWGTALPIDPGLHRVVASAPGTASRPIAIAVGPKQTTLEVVIAPLSETTKKAAAPGAAGQRETTTGHAQRGIGIALAGVGVLALGGGAFFALRARASFDDSGAHCRPDDSCDERGVALRSDAKSAALASTLLVVGGAVAVSAGAVLYLTAPANGRVAATFGPSSGGVAIERTF